jgi:hypothetical protein
MSQKMVLKYFQENPTSSLNKASLDLGLSLATIKNDRKRLIDKQLLQKKDKQGRFIDHPALIKECEEVGLPVEKTSNYWYKGKHFSIHVKGEQFSMWDFKEQLIKDLQQYAPKYPKIRYPKILDGHLLVVDPADIHIGKLCKAFESGDEYNHKIAIDRVKAGVIGLLQKSAGFPIDQILFIVGNDILHTDNAKSTTTSGTFQDTELMWFDAFGIAKTLLIDVIEILLTVAPVHVQYDPSNHDYVSGFMLAQTIEAWFRNANNITFNVSPSHRKYFKYGLNVIGSTHADGAKVTDLALLMAHEAPYWQECKHRYVYCHHIHHKFAKDFMSVTIEYLRSPSGTDSWHHRNGYQHAPKAVEGYIHHKIHGQIARVTHLF